MDAALSQEVRKKVALILEQIGEQDNANLNLTLQELAQDMYEWGRQQGINELRSLVGSALSQQKPT